MLIPVKENIPGRKEFKTRFQKKLRGVAPLFEPIIDQLAEEAESVIYETWLKTSVPEPKKEEDPFIHLFRKSLRPQEPYYCNNCRNDNIYFNYKFCPKCGIGIKWYQQKAS
jgi:hypothetical protein